MIEQEVKLPFPHVDAARQAITATGAVLSISRRLLEDRLYDTAQGFLRLSGRALRIRRDGAQAGFLTFKGPVQPGPVKSREELETAVGDPALVDRVLANLGYFPMFRSQKYREEYDLPHAHLALDEAPAGVFVEIEAAPPRIEEVARLLGRTPADYVLDSYVSLWRRRCEARGVPFGDMVFDSVEESPRP
jgi:predicted adenylyl cyclase CyaB